MSKVVLAIGKVNILATSFAAALLIVAIYGGYFLMTYYSAKRMASLE
jgi:putative ABC transport system permease protein